LIETFFSSCCALHWKDVLQKVWCENFAQM